MRRQTRPFMRSMMQCCMGSERIASKLTYSMPLESPLLSLSHCKVLKTNGYLTKICFFFTLRYYEMIWILFLLLSSRERYVSMAFMKKYIHVAKGIKVSRNHTPMKYAVMFDNRYIYTVDCRIEQQHIHRVVLCLLWLGLSGIWSVRFWKERRETVGPGETP